MATIAELLATALNHHQAGNLPEAEKLYRHLLQDDPDNAEAMHLLGVIAHQNGRHDVAVEHIRRALHFRPFAEAYNNLGVALKAQGKLAEAVASYQEALRLKPDYADAHNNLGIAFKELGRFAEALDSYQRALLLAPNSAEAHNNLGNILMEQDHLDEALNNLRTALRLKPDYVEAHNNLGNVLNKQDQLEAAKACLETALRLKSNYADAYNNLGNVLQRQGKPAEALANYEQAIRCKPAHGEAHWNKALALLLLGDFGPGWAEYEWRWKSKTFQERYFRQPLWDGAALAGRTILLHAEQGLGDTLHFIRYAPLVQARGGRVVVEFPKALLPLLAGVRGIDQLVPAGTPLPAFDVHVPLLSLPGIFGAHLTNLPTEIPYLAARPELLEHWRRELSAIAGFKVGIAWQGSPTFRADRQRSIPLAQFAPLAQVPGVRLISLQKGYGTEQLGTLAELFTVIDLGHRLDETNGPFMDTAAVMKNVDLVITSDTATAHLAGALGVPVWVALPLVPDWRWLLNRDDSPWYPSMRLFRQSRRGDWTDVFERMACELATKSCGAALGPAIHVPIAPGELLDKITILRIKSTRITDDAKLRNVHAELALLEAARARSVAASAELDALTAQLQAANEQLWDIEDAIRLCERQQDFGLRFIDLARSVYRHNDQRASLKRRINDLLGSTLVEEKSYAEYQ